MVGEGKAVWCTVHVHDLSNLYLRLIEEAAKGGGNATWGKEGFYFSDGGEAAWGDIARIIGKQAKEAGLLKEDVVKSISFEEAQELRSHGGYIWGTNSRGRGLRARKLLGWEPMAEEWNDTIPALIQEEAMKLGLTKGHAEEVTQK
jgi:nucleoside-diphosphate-sugar epimerase